MLVRGVMGCLEARVHESDRVLSEGGGGLETLWQIGGEWEAGGSRGGVGDGGREGGYLTKRVV